MDEHERLTEKTIGCFEYDLKNFQHIPGEFGTYEAFYAYSMAVRQLGKYEDMESLEELNPKTMIAKGAASERARITDLLALNGFCTRNYRQCREECYDCWLDFLTPKEAQP